MPHVSYRRIDKENFKKIYVQLIKLIEKSGNTKNSGKLLKELLFPTEKVMLAKRVAIILMIHEEIPDRTIASTLSVSTSTVGRMLEKYDRGDYKYIVSMIEKEEFELGKMLELILYGVLPPRVGKERARRLYKYL